MSTNKLKYWEVTTTSIVKANTKAEALKAARSSRPVPGTKVETRFTEGNRISAAEARVFMGETV